MAYLSAWPITLLPGPWLARISHRACHRSGLGRDRAPVRLLGNLAVGHQHRHDHRDFSDDIHYSEISNKESKVIQLKLNELIAASRFTSNRMVDIEDLTEEELNVRQTVVKNLKRINVEFGPVFEAST